MANLRAIPADLQVDVSYVYDEEKTFASSLAIFQKLFQGTPIIGASFDKWLDVFTDSAEIPIDLDYNAATSRLFVITAVTSGLARVMYYTFDKDSGSFTYHGKIQLTFANLAVSVHALRGYGVDDSNTSNIKIVVTTTTAAGTTLINGGTYLGNKIALADFTPVLTTTLGFPSGDDQRAMYFLQDPAQIGALQLQNASVGLILDKVNKIAYCHNGTAATHQYYKYNYGAAPTWSAAAVTSNDATDFINHAGHTFNNNDPIVFPTSAIGGIAAGAIVFVRNPIAGGYNVSATSGGANINLTTSSAATVGRAFGTTGSNWIEKTGNGPALTGVLTLNSSEDYVVPGHTLNAGVPCAFFSTSLNLYLVKLSDLTSGATLWPSLTPANILGTANQVVVPALVTAGWSHFLDAAIFTTSTTKIIVKKMVNNQFLSIFGVLNNDYLEGVSQTDLVTQLGAVTVAALKQKGGWTFLLGSSTGQRGVIAHRLATDYTVGNDYLITKVLDIDAAKYFVGITASQMAGPSTAPFKTYYRTTGFSVPTGNWILLPENQLMLGINTTGITKIQFKIEYVATSPLSSNMAQIIDFFFAYAPLNSMSTYWKPMSTGTTEISPSKTVYRQSKLYGGSAPTLYHRGVDLSGNIVEFFNTVTHVAQFDYSIDEGDTWVAGVGPDLVGKRLRFTRTNPPSVIINNSLSEE